MSSENPEPPRIGSINRLFWNSAGYQWLQSGPFLAVTVADPPAFHVKAIAIASMILVGGYSIFFAVEATGLKITGGVFVALGLVTVLLLKMCKEKAG